MLAALLAGCNFTTQSYNHGKLLNPGETLAGIGVGKREYYRINDRVDSVKRTDTVRFSKNSYCLDYRLGVLRTRPLGRGLEIGFHLEGPGQLNPSERARKNTALWGGIMILDFDARLGLKDIAMGRGLFHHNIGLGWRVGAWIDNGWFAEYAAGWEYGRLLPYANVRAELMPTDPAGMDSLFESRTPFKYHNQLWTARAAMGVSVRLPHWFFLEPDYLTPEVTVVCPHFSAVSRCGFTYHVGLRWLNGI
jgi:hypothetical protein